MTAAQRILVRAPSWVGDAVMATPALRSLRSANPAAEIVVEGRPVLESLLHGLSSFDEFLPDVGGRSARDILRRAHALRRRRFDLAVLLPDSARAALGPYLARIPRRAGYARDAARRALLNDSLETPRGENGKRIPIPMVERYLRITRHIGCRDRGDRMELVVDEDEAIRVERALAKMGIGPGEPLLVVAPGASFGPSKLWPAEHFAVACGELHERFGLRPIIAPAPAEVAIAQAVCARESSAQIFGATGRTTLAGLKALVARARLVLSNDTGPRHIAVALGVPVITLLGPTDPRHTAAHLEQQRVLREDISCSPCQKKVCPIDHRCMTQLSPDRVIEAANELLSRESARVVPPTPYP